MARQVQPWPQSILEGGCPLAILIRKKKRKKKKETPNVPIIFCLCECMEESLEPRRETEASLEPQKVRWEKPQGPSTQEWPVLSVKVSRATVSTTAVEGLALTWKNAV